ncbi:helix-turn-helix domain-containing protein [Paenibacillus pabuli]|uniref:AlbA family DNA-binding domain-containing protein n=1 Tax=Paenibacillus pabuli TaxID=1472 RepID=UPI003CF2F510
MYNSQDKFFELVGLGTENNKWDYKRDIHISPNIAFANLLKDILAFSNSGGGWLVLGVDDNSRIIGIEKKIDPTSLGEKIISVLGEQVLFDLNYYTIHDEFDKVVGLLYVHDSDKVLVSPIDLYNEKGKPIVSEHTIYFRRNTSSIKANIDDINLLIHKVSVLGKYDLKAEDIEFLKDKKSEYSMFKEEDAFYKGEFQFSVSKFAEKLNTIYRFHQSKYTKYEIGILLGFEIAAIDEYFEGRRFPKIEHLIRAVEIFDLPHDYFFQTTVGMEKPFIHNPLITYIILEKTTGKVDLYEYGFGSAFNTIISDLARKFSHFKKWLFSERGTYKPSDRDIDSLVNENTIIFQTFEEYLLDLSDHQYNKFKQHLKIQYYKEIEKTPEENEKFLNEKIKTRLIYSNTDFVCKFISELIKTIKTSEGKIHIEYNFIYEVQNKVVRYRDYDRQNLKVEFCNRKTFDEFISSEKERD